MKPIAFRRLADSPRPRPSLTVDDHNAPEPALSAGGDTASTRLAARIQAACERIAPVWPLDRFVAVNPFHGLRDQSFPEAAAILERVAGARLYAPRTELRAAFESGQITREDLRHAAELQGVQTDPETLIAALAEEPRPRQRVPLVSRALDALEGGDWSGFVIDRISHHCAAYFDMGQATWKQPWKGFSLYASWRRSAGLDLSPALMGLGGVRKRVAALPETPRDTIRLLLERLEIPADATVDYLHALLMDIGGWAAWTRRLRWEAELTGGRDDRIEELLAIRLAWDWLLRERLPREHWQAALGEFAQTPAAATDWTLDHVWLTARELAYQRQLVARLGSATPNRPAEADRPRAQAAFCIDVRSEVMRRSLELVAPEIQTLGFAGFFGVPIAHRPFGTQSVRAHVPVLLTPRYQLGSELQGVDAETRDQTLATQRRQVGLSQAWKAFKMGASSCFSFVESAGIWLYAPKLISDSLGWSRPVPAPDDPRLPESEARHLGPSLECGHHHDHHGGSHEAATCQGEALGIPAAERVALAEGILRAMSLSQGLAPLVLLVGHGSTSVNNPHASGLDCGACGGQTGEASARAAAALLNDPAVRQGLAERGLRIPDDTWFLPGLHDTTTDVIRLFDTASLPASHAGELAELEEQLARAGELTRAQRAGLLGLGGREGQTLAASLQRRARDWSQVRPEWGLAGNGAFIAAPRTRTQGLDLEGRTFLHDYVWRDDTDFAILELIMTAPMVVATWINLQYYGSSVDNRRFGSGNKVLHNVVGGAVGVLEGNAGDLRVGLSLQSLHDGRRWIHEPLRLSVFLQVPEAPIEAIIARHTLVRQLLDNGWLHLFRLDDDGGCRRRLPGRGWANAEDQRLH